MLGKDLLAEPGSIRPLIACVAQFISIYQHLSLLENFLFQSRLYKVDPQTAQKRIKLLVKNFGLSPYLNYPTQTLSGGLKRRLDIAMNMVSSPRILFLDEPTLGLDVESRRSLWEILENIRTDFGTTIFLTTHYLEEAERLSDTICIMNKGQIIKQGSPSDLRGFTRQNVLRIGFSDQSDARNCSEKLKKNGMILSGSLRKEFLFVTLPDAREGFFMLNRWLLEQQIAFTSIEITKPTLEDVFLALTTARLDDCEVLSC
jgi:ABC-2 type transport system ATP-binding protein